MDAKWGGVLPQAANNLRGSVFRIRDRPNDLGSGFRVRVAGFRNCPEPRILNPKSRRDRILRNFKLVVKNFDLIGRERCKARLAIDQKRLLILI